MLSLQFCPGLNVHSLTASCIRQNMSARILFKSDHNQLTPRTISHCFNTYLCRGQASDKFPQLSVRCSYLNRCPCWLFAKSRQGPTRFSFSWSRSNGMSAGGRPVKVFSSKEKDDEVSLKLILLCHRPQTPFVGEIIFTTILQTFL